MSIRRCVECGELGANVKHLDSAGELSWFHSNCWLRLWAWLWGRNDL
jgi:hypothetical protein